MTDKPDFKAFADAVLQSVWDGCELDAAQIQGIAAEGGLIKLTTVTEPCCADCICADAGDFPTQCYRKTYKLGV